MGGHDGAEYAAQRIVTARAAIMYLTRIKLDDISGRAAVVDAVAEEILASSKGNAKGVFFVRVPVVGKAVHRRSQYGQIRQVLAFYKPKLAVLFHRSLPEAR